ncbi:MAG: S-layer homology domain-containing protein [Fimbriimonas sp.]
MKRTFTYALAAVLAAGMVTPAMAQDNFPDVPENHWAFEALARLKAAGILVGYPDGLYRGGRPASRYELAVALHAAFQNLQNAHNGLAGQLEDLRKKVDSMGGGSPFDPSSLISRITALENQVNALKSLGDDMANMKRMADTFQRELQSLGVDVEAMKRDLGDLADRVAKLEARKPAVDISGDANFWLGAGASNNGNLGLDMDGRINGTNNPGGLGGAVGLTRDLTLLHEVALVLAGTNETGPKWRGTVVVGNMLSGGGGAGFGNQSQPMYGFGYTEGSEDVYLQDLGIKFDTSIAGLGFNAELGRVGYKVSPYVYQRMDKTSYFDNERWDNGQYYFDGGVLGFNFGAAKLDVFGGRNSNRNSVNNVDMNPPATGPLNGMFAGPGGSMGPALNIDRTLGVNFNVPLTTAGNLNLAYLWLDSNGAITAAAANRLAVFGGTLDFALGAIKLEGSYSQSDLQRNSRQVNNKNNKAVQLKAGWNGDKWGLWGLYREVDANFLAPGDWGRLGIIRNPTNIKGFQVGGHLDLTNALTISAMGEFDKGKSNTFAGTTGFNSNTKIEKFAINLGYKLNSNTGLMFGYEDTQFKNVTAVAPVVLGGTPRYKWTTFGINYGLSDQAKLSVQYQISDVRNEFVLRNGVQRYNGGLLSTQLSVKF